MVIVRTATVADLVALLEQRAELTLSRARYRALLSQVALGDAWAVYEAEPASHPLLVAGIAPIVPGAGELWLGVRRGGLGSGLLPFVRIARETIRSQSPRYPVGLMALVECGHRPGERLARLLGCVPQNVILGKAREWVWHNGHDR